MSYAQYFFENIASTNEAVKGTCFTMCPEQEDNLRVREHMVHTLEVDKGVRKLVKSYSRSAADSTMAVPSLLRPFPVLKSTVEYLLFVVTKRADVPTCILYDFINDRLRAVRQDMTIQRLAPAQCCQLLEPMVRFYVYYGYELCELPINDFEPTLNNKYQLECMKWYLSCSDQMTDFTDLFSALDVKEGNLNNDRLLMESLYLLSNLGDVHPVIRYLNLPKRLQREPTLLLAYKISLANLNGNFVRVCRLSEKLCPLTQCVFALKLNAIQRRGLLVLSHAYNNQRLSVPAAAVAQWLRVRVRANDGEWRELRDLCAHYGLRVTPVDGGGVVRFCKAEFDESAKLMPPKKLDCGELDFSLYNIFTYKT